jgi:hypothetical protein
MAGKSRQGWLSSERITPGTPTYYVEAALAS